MSKESFFGDISFFEVLETSLNQAIEYKEGLMNLKEFQITKYTTPLSIKESIANDCVEAYFVKNINDEVIDFSEMEKEKTLLYRLTQYYTDIKIPTIKKKKDEDDSDFINRAYHQEQEFVDTLIENGSRDIIYSKLTSDLYFINKIIDAKIEFKKYKMKEEISTGKVIKDLFGSLIEKIPDSESLNSIVESIKGFDPSKLKMLSEMIKVV